jgi:signal transduction histidine kinase
MVRGTNLSHDAKAAWNEQSESGSSVAKPRKPPGVRTHVLLVLAMALVTVLVTSLCLLLVRHRLREQVTADLSRDLDHSVVNFHNLEAERLGALERENALLAELPPLKALMTSGDDLTIQDGAVEWWQLSGNDLFALADSTGRVVAVYSSAAPVDATLRTGVRALVASPAKHYLIDGRWLYACSVRPLYFGSETSGTLLGYVISGVSTERTVREVSQPTGVEATFLSKGEVVASTLSASAQAELARQPLMLSNTPRTPATVKLGNTSFLAATEDLSASATSALQLVVLKSLEPEERSINRIDRIVLSAGLLALLSGTALMIVLARLLTRPLEELAAGVRAFGEGDTDHEVPQYGTREVRELSTAFAGMRSEIKQANQALLEAERLATIGRMASSVSHDLRHYLAAIYANAEFLLSDQFSSVERAEIFADIRAAVHGTTDMIESLLIFSRNGGGMKGCPELLATLIERAVALGSAHPDAEGIEIKAHYHDPAEALASVDGKQIERALFNLILNACQSVRSMGGGGNVDITLEVLEQYLVISVKDDGAGVPEKIRESLFEPFVSEGKQKGTGLGLTLAHCIALEHGGGVSLLSSRPGETIFELRILREFRSQGVEAAPCADPSDEVISDETVRIETESR